MLLAFSPTTQKKFSFQIIKMNKFIQDAGEQNNPLRALREFLKREKEFEQAKAYDSMRFVGYVLDIGYNEITITTTDNFKINVGGVPRNSMLIMCPDNYEYEGRTLPPHFTLLRVLDSAPTPLSSEDQQTFFELHKRSMPELDVFTENQLQWGALKTNVLGMFYINPDKKDTVEFSGDLNNYVSAHKYKIYAPDDELLDLVNNSIVPQENRFRIGELRLTECRLPLPDKKRPNVGIYLSTKDFMACRTAMFGKTRLGKSNVVKLIAQSILETTKKDKNVGQLIFDINGEYANDNPQDGNVSIRSAYKDQCVVYALTPKTDTPSKPLKINFYEHPASSHRIIATLLRETGRDSIYIDRFLSVDIPSLEQASELTFGEKDRAIRKILTYWTILNKAGFPVDEAVLKSKLDFDFGMNKTAMKVLFGDDDTKWPSTTTLDELYDFLAKVIEKDRTNKLASSTKGKNLFDAEDDALFNFLIPTSAVSAGPGLLQSIKIYHDNKAGNFVAEILVELDKGKTVILDLGNANEEVMQYFSRELSTAVFRHQTTKFTANKLGKHYIQIYFEEAHNLFGDNDNSEETKIYRRFAKEGEKYHIGMVYSTQSPSTVNSDLLAQTENFFILHLASKDDVNKLAKLNVAYESMKDDILRAKTVGFVRMLTRSHRFVVSMQALQFTPPAN